MVFVFYLLGIVVVVLIGLVLKKIFYFGVSESLIMDMLDYEILIL